MMAKLSDGCNRDFYKAAHISGRRRIKDIRWLVIHSTETAPGSARSVARYFQSPSSGGSAHLTVDDKSCYRSLANEDIPWAAPPANTEGFHVEFVGYAKWSKATWLLHINTLRRGAYKFAQHLKLFERQGNVIPAVFVDAAGLRAGKKGITTHAQISKAWKRSTHTDPGADFPMGVFLWLVRRYLKEV